MFLRHKNFKKQYQKLNLSTRKKVAQKLILFSQDANNATLKNHELKGKWLGYRSINITGDIRAIYKKENEVIVFIAIGSHSDLYK